MEQGCTIQVSDKTHIRSFCAVRGCTQAHCLIRKAHTPTCDSVLDLSLHLEGVHVDGPVPNEAGAGDAPVRLAEPVLVVVISGKNTGCKRTRRC